MMIRKNKLTLIIAMLASFHFYTHIVFFVLRYQSSSYFNFLDILLNFVFFLGVCATWVSYSIKLKSAIIASFIIYFLVFIFYIITITIGLIIINYVDLIMLAFIVEFLIIGVLIGVFIVLMYDKKSI